MRISYLMMFHLELFIINLDFLLNSNRRLIQF